MKYEYKQVENRVVAIDGEREVGEITYADRGDDVWVFNHTYVNPSHRGGGVAGGLLQALVDEAIKQGKKIHPTCSFVVRAFEANPEYQKLQV